MRFPAAILLSLLLLPSLLPEQRSSDARFDSDHDGLSDSFEAALLARFEPTFVISVQDCSEQPARFADGHATPRVLAEDGTIYGQAFPSGHASRRAGDARQIELHYYHLWRRDCGEMGHPLDAEHVSVLLEDAAPAAYARPETTPDTNALRWKARYWYAAAHEDTVCDASQIVRAEALNAEDHGPKVWISSGKHGSFFDERLCTHGCGGDRCRQMESLPRSVVINLGEAGNHPAGVDWVESAGWPLIAKMTRSDFPAARRARLDSLPESSIAWANPSKRPMQAAILGANVGAHAGLGGAATGLAATDVALTTANGHTDASLGQASRETGNALKKSYIHVRGALGKAARKTGEALDRDRPTPEEPPE